MLPIFLFLLVCLILNAAADGGCPNITDPREESVCLKVLGLSPDINCSRQTFRVNCPSFCTINCTSPNWPSTTSPFVLSSSLISQAERKNNFTKTTIETPNIPTTSTSSSSPSSSSHEAMHIYISVAIAAIVLVAMVVCSMRLRRQKINNPNFGFQLGWNRHYARARGQSMGTYESPTPTAQHHIPNFDTSDANSRKSNSSDYVLSDSDDANYDDEPLDTNSDAGYDFLNLEGAHFGYPPTRSLSETNRHYMAPESVEQQLLHALRAYIGAHTNHTANSNDDELKSSSLEEHVSSEHLSKLIERISGESSQSESIVESLETFKENLNDYSDPVCSHETSKDMHEIAFDPSADFHVDISTNDMPTLQPLSEEIGNFIKKLDDVTAKDVSKMTYDEVRESLSKLDRVAFRDLVTIHKNLISRLVILAFGEFPNGKLTLRLIRVLICDLVGLSPEEVSQADRSILRSIVASVMNDIKFANSSSQLKKMSKGASQLHIDLQIAELNQQIEMIDKVAQVENELREVEDLLEKGSPSPSSSPISSDLPKNSENNGYLMVQGFDDEIVYSNIA